MGTLTRVRFESTTLELSPLLSSRPGSFNDQGTVSQKSRKLPGLIPLMSLQRRDSKPSNLATLLVRRSFPSKNVFFYDSKMIFCDFSDGMELENEKTERRQHFYQIYNWLPFQCLCHMKKKKKLLLTKLIRSRCMPGCWPRSNFASLWKRKFGFIKRVDKG